MQFRMLAEYRRRVTRRYLSLPPAWHRRHPTGTLLANASADIESLWWPLAMLPLAVGTIVMLLAAVIGLLAVDWAFALVGLAIFPALFAVNFVYSRHMSPRVAAAQAMRARTSAIAHESFDGALVVKTMGRENDETHRFEAQAHRLRDEMIRVGKVRGAFDPLLEVLPSLGSLTVLLVGVLRVQQGAVSGEEVFIVAFLFTVLAVPIRAIAMVLTELPRSVAGWDRVRPVLHATGDMVYGTATAPGPGAGPVSLSLRDVRYRYDSTVDSAAPASLVLDGVTFDVPAGATVALVGPTGSGKSTIASLAARLIDPVSGSVQIGGVDARTLTAADLTRTVALVPQLPFVFDDTVRGNVALDRPGIGDDEVMEALRLAQAETFVEKLPNGLDTELGERGASLSGGQRQRLTLARALAGAPRLLILDDATSAVDPRVEAAILAGLRSEAPAATILVVAYRRATISLADEVVFLERGQVVAQGAHQRLLATAPGYAELVTAYERADAEREREHLYDESAVDGPAATVGSETVDEVADELGRPGVAS
jgi:ABC-type multidrug transport system fused ATPase/permease subunit